MTGNPTRLTNLRHGGKRLSQLFDGGSLWHAIRLVADVFAPVALCTAVLFAAAYLLYSFGDERWRLYQDNTDRQVIVEQLDRAATVEAPDIAFVGDSSCLMGIGVPLLRGAFPGKSIESFCTIAYAGPVGYGRIVTRLLERSATPKTLIIALHPDPFVSTPSADWASYPNLTTRRTSAAMHPIDVLDYLRIRWLGLLLHQPLQRNYGLYYGSDAAFRALLWRSHGSAVDPNSGLDARSLEDLGRIPKYTHPRFSAFIQSYSMSVGFLDAVDALGKVLSRLDRRRVFFLIAPVPDSTFPPNGDEAQRAAALTIAGRLGLPKDRILPLPGHFPDMYFSSVTHLNRWGRIVYTRMLADQLRTLP
jgi:hypothetical protein